MSTVRARQVDERIPPIPIYDLRCPIYSRRGCKKARIRGGVLRLTLQARRLERGCDLERFLFLTAAVAVAVEAAFFPLALLALGKGRIDFGKIGFFAEAAIDGGLQGGGGFDEVALVGLHEDGLAAGIFETNEERNLAGVGADDFADA